MNATPESIAAGGPVPQEQAQGSNPPPAPPSLDDLKRDYIAPVEMAERGQAAVEKAISIAQAHNLPVEFTFNTEEDLPMGFGVGIVPLTKQNEKKGEKSIKVGLIIAQIPDPKLLVALDPEKSTPDAPVPLHAQGEGFIRNLVLSRFMSKVASAKKAQESGPVAMPVSVEDFIAGRGGESLEAFRALVDSFVKGLKKKGFKLMTQPLLKQILSSAAMAEQLHGTIPQTVWVQVLDAMIATAQSKGIEPGALQTWKDTRDSVTVTEPNELDADSLLDLISDDLAKVGTE